MRDWIFATILAVCAAMIVVGAAEYSAGVAWIVAGILGAAWATLVMVVGEAGTATAPELAPELEVEADLEVGE